MRSLAILVAVALAAAVGGAAASGAVPPGLAGLLGGQRVVRAEVVVVQGTQVHDYRVDNGRIVSLSTGSVGLAERDGTTQTVPLDPSVAVTLNGRPSALTALQVGMQATTIRDGDAGATTLTATGSGGPKAAGGAKGGGDHGQRGRRGRRRGRGRG